MITELLWGSDQQIRLLFYSTVVGFGLGVGFGIINGFGRLRSRTRRFVIDVVYCCFAAIVTFFTSLVLNHGILHPVLFIGLMSGVLIEHRIIGRLVSKSAYRFARFVRFVLLGLADSLRKMVLFLFRLVRRGRDKVKKQRKIL